MTDSKIIDAYKELDEKLNKLINDFWEKYPGIQLSTSGSVLYGEWHVMRDNKFDGLTFKVNWDQMTELVSNKSVTLSHHQLITQEKLE